MLCLLVSWSVFCSARPHGFDKPTRRNFDWDKTQESRITCKPIRIILSLASEIHSRGQANCLSTVPKSMFENNQQINPKIFEINLRWGGICNFWKNLNPHRKEHFTLSNRIVCFEKLCQVVRNHRCASPTRYWPDFSILFQLF